jgi:RimJ/RimL family protein N-acetyltransferase
MNAIEVTHFTKRLVLEPLSKQHAAKLFDGLSSPKLYEYVPQDPPGSLQELEGRYEKLEGRISPDCKSLLLNWACRLIASDVYIGLVEITLDVGNVDALMAYFIFVDHQRQGYAGEACEVVLDHIFKDYEAASSSAAIEDSNAASIALIQKLGFAKRGHSRPVDPFKGKPRSEGTYEITRQLWTNRLRSDMQS